MRTLTLDRPKLWSNEWFYLWQNLLLIMVNFPILSLREKIRYKLEIDLDRNIPIDRLLRNSFRIRIADNTYQETFYGKPVFAVALKKEWSMLWSLIHNYDTRFANYISPALNLGFDTLTKYPDADPETNTCDGMVRKSATAMYFSTIHDDSSGSSTNAANVAGNISLYEHATTENKYTLLTRCIFLFDTSQLTSASTITDAKLYLYTYSSEDAFGTTVDIVTSSPASNTTLAASDYYYTGFGTDSLANRNIVGTGYLEYAISGGFYNTIIKDGITKYGARLGFDLANSVSGWYGGYYADSGIYFADNGAQYAPKLVITYTLPVTGQQQQNII